jgi:hypothetical protein
MMRMPDARMVYLLVALLTTGALTSCEDSHHGTSLTEAPLAAAAQRPSRSAEDEGAESAPQQDDEPDYHYSPFALRLENHADFEVISFKDVGLDRSADEPNDFLYETVAQSLAMELNRREKLGVRSEVYFDEALADPKNHLACGQNHLYVDVWRSSQPDRWGYSLWSGCGEMDNFAWREVEMHRDPERQPFASVSELTGSIAETLDEATRTHCYTREC